MREVRIFVAVFVLIFSAGMAGADTVMTGKNHTDGFELMGQKRPASDTQEVVWVGKGMMRQDVGDITYIVRADQKKAFYIDHKGKSYSAFDLPVDMTKALAPEAAQVYAQLAPMMKKEVKLTATDETKKIGAWAARKFILNVSTPMGAVITTTFWATKDIKLDLPAYRDMATQFLTLNLAGDDLIQEMNKIDGITVLAETSTSVMGVNIGGRQELSSVEEKTALAGTYEVPAGYTLRPFNPFQQMMDQDEAPSPPAPPSPSPTAPAPPPSAPPAAPKK